MKNKKEKSQEFWKELIEHVDNSYQKFKGYKYPFLGRDFRELKGMARIYQVSGVMSLWDQYLDKDNEWARKNGYSITEFCRQMPRLLDSNWKSGMRKYEDQLSGAIKMPVELKVINSSGGIK